MRPFTVGPTSRFSLFANEVLPNQAFSTRIDGDQPFFAERSMFVSFDGDVVPQITAPATQWLFAEGETGAPFQTWLLLQNPNLQTATATVNYLLEGGGTRTQIVGLPPASRTSIFVDSVLPNAAFSVQVLSDLPIVAEEAMYRFPGNAATANAGVQDASTTWFFAEGATVVHPFGLDLPMDTWLLIQNPNNAVVPVTITLFDPAGNVNTIAQSVAPLSRLSLLLDPLTTFESFAIQVDGSAPIVVQRSGYFGTEPKGAISTFGASRLDTIWNFAEGSTAPPFTEVISVLNPHNENMGISLEFFLAGGQTVTKEFIIGLHSKFSLPVDSVISNAANSVQVTTSLPCVAERTMYLSNPGGIGGTNTVGIPG